MTYPVFCAHSQWRRLSCRASLVSFHRHNPALIRPVREFIAKWSILPTYLSYDNARRLASLVSIVACVCDSNCKQGLHRRLEKSAPVEWICRRRRYPSYRPGQSTNTRSRSCVIIADEKIGVQVAPSCLVRGPLELPRDAEHPRTSQRSSGQEQLLEGLNY
jgi:hypothetical protein